MSILLGRGLTLHDVVLAPAPTQVQITLPPTSPLLTLTWRCDEPDVYEAIDVIAAHLIEACKVEETPLAWCTQLWDTGVPIVLTGQLSSVSVGRPAAGLPLRYKFLLVPV